MIVSHFSFGALKEWTYFFFLFQYVKDIILLGFTTLVQVRSHSELNWTQNYFTYFQVGNLIVEVSRVKDSVKKLLETDFELYNVRKQELFSVFHKCFE